MFDDICLVTKVEKDTLLFLYPIVFMLAMLSATAPMALDWADNPETPACNAPKILIIFLLKLKN